MMKTILKRLMLTMLLLSGVAAGGVIKAEESETEDPVRSLRTDRIWEYSVLKGFGMAMMDSVEMNVVRFAITGSEHKLIRNGKQGEYKRFMVWEMISGKVYYQNGTEREYQPKGYRFLLREDNGKIWMWLDPDRPVWRPVDPDNPQEPVDEKLVYDFNLTTGDSILLCEQPLEWLISDPWYMREVPIECNPPVVIDGQECRSYTLEVYPEEYWEIPCVECVGAVKRGLLAGPFLDDVWGWKNVGPPNFSRLMDMDGSVLYESDLYSWEENLAEIRKRYDDYHSVLGVEAETSPADRLYDLQGRELREPVPGQPYIKGGKVLVAPK